MIAFRNFALRRGERLLLSEVDIALHAGARVGVIGRNGCGKSSLFAVILGELEADKGDVVLPNRLRVASVAQETPALPETALDFVLAGDAELFSVIRAEAEATAAEDWDAVAQAHEKLAELNGYDANARAGRLLHGLGFDAEAQWRPVAAFSGGWRARLNLARALMTPSDLLLLDEPTNHLDLDAVLWLEQWLLKYPGMLMMISHDREFLDGLSTHTLHLHEGRAKLYTGDYTSFERQRAEHLRLQQIAFEKEQAEREHLQAFIDRFKAKASKAKQAQSRMKRLAKLSGTEAVRAEREFRISFADPIKLPNSLLRLNDVDAGYRSSVGGEDVEAAETIAILHKVRFGLEAGDRIGLLGPNGAGKSTLFRMIIGQEQPDSGEITMGPTVKLAYVDQSRDKLEGNHNVFQEVSGGSDILNINGIEIQSRAYIGRFNFKGQDQQKLVGTLSGGERGRLHLAKTLLQGGNVLLLDEPSNDLDIETLRALEDALLEFPGCALVISHDRWFLDRIATHILAFEGDSHVEFFQGNYREYEEDKKRRLGAEAAQPHRLRFKALK